MAHSSEFLPSKSKFAFERTADSIAPNRKGHVYLWTFTFVEVLAVADGRRRWSKFLRRLREAQKRKGKQFDGAPVGCKRLTSPAQSSLRPGPFNALLSTPHVASVIKELRADHERPSVKRHLEIGTPSA